MRLKELVSMCSVRQMFSVMNYSNGGATIYRGQLGIDALICQYEVRLIAAYDGFIVVYVDVE